MDATFPGSLIFTGEFPVNTSGTLDILDITDQLRQVVERSGVKEGVVSVFVAGSTAGLTTVEFEPGAVTDLKKAFERLAPRDMEYAHNAAWGDGNGHSHVRAALLGPDITIPVRRGSPLLGTWQQVVLVEFDTRSRDRNLHVTVMGVRTP